MKVAQFQKKNWNKLYQNLYLLNQKDVQFVIDLTKRYFFELSNENRDITKQDWDMLHLIILEKKSNKTDTDDMNKLNQIINKLVE